MSDKKRRCEEIWSGKAGIKKEYPEGKAEYDPRMGIYLAEFARGDKCAGGDICEVGCGSGRLAGYFSDREYTGVDINAEAIAKARKDNPGYEFHHVGYEEEWPEAECYLFHTVLLHIPDEYLDGMIQRCGGNRVVVAETMDPQFRDGQYTFHRSSAQYKEAFERNGYRLTEERRMYIEGFPGFWDLHKYIFGGEAQCGLE